MESGLFGLFKAITIVFLAGNPEKAMVNLES
jgi:hypothetical protein